MAFCWIEATDRRLCSDTFFSSLISYAFKSKNPKTDPFYLRFALEWRLTEENGWLSNYLRLFLQKDTSCGTWLHPQPPFSHLGFLGFYVWKSFGICHSQIRLRKIMSGNAMHFLAMWEERFIKTYFSLSFTILFSYLCMPIPVKQIRESGRSIIFSHHIFTYNIFRISFPCVLSLFVCCIKESICANLGCPEKCPSSDDFCQE